VRWIRVTLERSWTRRRVWLKAQDSDGTVEIIQNIPIEDATTLRNKLLDKLTASGLYDEVISDPIKAYPDPSPNPWTIVKKSNPRKRGYEKKNEDTNGTSERNQGSGSFGVIHGGKSKAPGGDPSGQ
jgi:hypothetical protein